MLILLLLLLVLLLLQGGRKHRTDDSGLVTERDVVAEDVKMDGDGRGRVGQMVRRRGSELIRMIRTGHLDGISHCDTTASCSLSMQIGLYGSTMGMWTEQ
jgi:hypothetical protein